MSTIDDYMSGSDKDKLKISYEAIMAAGEKITQEEAIEATSALSACGYHYSASIIAAVMCHRETIKTQETTPDPRNN